MIVLLRHRLIGSALFLCMASLLVVPAGAFSANSLDITINANGDATATFRFTLEGLIENAIPQSILEGELVKGLTTSADAPALISMDRSSATLLLKKFADTSDVQEGTEYRTATMNFKKAEIALQSSALSSVVTADFSPSRITVTFPDGYSWTMDNQDVLPSLSHTVIDSKKAASAALAASSSKTNIQQAQTGTLRIISSPADVQVYLDGNYIGNAPAQYPDIPAGEHTLMFEKSGFMPVTRTLAVKPGESLQVSAVLAYATPVSAATSAAASPGLDAYVTAVAVIVAVLGISYRRRVRRS